MFVSVMGFMRSAPDDVALGAFAHLAKPLARVTTLIREERKAAGIDVSVMKAEAEEFLQFVLGSVPEEIRPQYAQGAMLGWEMAEAAEAEVMVEEGIENEQAPTPPSWVDDVLEEDANDA